jgi:hypothetical protein
MGSSVLEWLKIIGPLVLSWPVAAVIIVLIFRKPLLRLLERLTSSDEGKAEIGPVKIELGKLVREGQVAVNKFNQINILMAESRLLELEITETTFGGVFSNDQRERMQEQIAELRRLTAPNEP